MSGARSKILRAVGTVAAIVVMLAALVALQMWRGPRRRGNPELDRQVEDSRRRLRDFKQRERERARREQLPPSSFDVDDAVRRLERGEAIDPLEGLSPAARKYLPADAGPPAP